MRDEGSRTQEGRAGGRSAAPLVVPAKIRVPVTVALQRERLESQLAQAFRHRLTLVVAPAGSGKTTLVARFAAGAGIPVGWYRAETWDADEASLVRHLEAALTGAVPGLRGGWGSVEDAARSLERRTGTGPALLVVDDGHALEETAAEAALERFVAYAPPWLAVVIASRMAPGFNLSRIRVAGELLEIGPDDLRFRAWEVEQLYRDVYRDPVPPGVLAALARRTEGWAAGLQLFHLASHGKPLEERQRLLSGVGSRSRLVREYLARNVLAELPAELRDFLRETCVLGRLSGRLCDRYLGTTGSARLLEELARRQVFTVVVEDVDDAYRYHEVLRSHLDRILVEDVGEAEARLRHARAGVLLEEDGALAEALAAYCRAEDWDAVERLLRRGGERLADGATGWLEALPPAIVRHDPWLALASARRARSEGRWSAALEAYGRAERGFGTAAAGLTSRQERVRLAAWLDPGAIPPSDWTGLLRGGLSREPMTAAREASQLDDVHRPLVRGLLWLAAGDVREAARALRIAADVAGTDGPLAAVAGLAAGVADVLAAEPAALGSLADAVEAAERARVPWLATLAREIAQRLTGADPIDDGVDRAPELDVTMADESAVPRDSVEDAWGTAIGALLTAWLVRPAGDPVAPERSSVTSQAERQRDIERRLLAAERAAALLRRLGSAVLEAWARGLVALAQAEAGASEARDAALAAESLGRSTGTAGARLLAYHALGVAEPGRAEDYALLAHGVEIETGLSVPGRTIPRHDAGARDAAAAATPWTAVPVGVPVGDGAPHVPTNGRGATAPGEADQGAPVMPPIRIQTLGGFRLEAAGRPVSLDTVKPRARALLRLLAIHADVPVHREVLQEALWPDVDAATGARSLQVGISALRGMLANALGAEGSRLIAREGDAYRLAVPLEAVDIRRFEQALATGRAARARGDGSGPAFRLALELHAGELLPEDGPAEWVVERREQLRLGAVEAARALAEEALAEGDLAEAVRASHAGLALDRYHDPLWRILIDARDLAGDAGAASRDRREYESVLVGLGLGAGSSAAPS